MNDYGSLYKNKKINKEGSLYYSEAIDRIINDPNTKIIIKYSETGIENLDGMTIVIKEFGGGATFFKKNEKDPSELYIYYKVLEQLNLNNKKRKVNLWHTAR